MATATFRIWRGDESTGSFQRLHDRSLARHGGARRRASDSGEQAGDLAVRWNCKAGKCGSCSAEINGMPKLMCMTRLNTLPSRSAGDRRTDEGISAREGPGHGRVVELQGEEDDPEIQAAHARCPGRHLAHGASEDVDRVQEFRKCIECYLCQDVCHVLRDHHMHDQFIGPRFLVYVAALEMHPLDVERPRGSPAERVRHRPVQYHQVLHQSLPGKHHHYRQRDYSSEGAGRRSVLRSTRKVVPHFQPTESIGDVMHFELKSISVESIPEALAKVERYRLLNEPSLAESICLDILAVVPDHQQALIYLLLARTDQFHSKVQLKETQEVLARIKGDYEEAYYAGVIWERLGNARIRHGDPGARASAYHALTDAMGHYERAMRFAPSGNDDAILRWNTCARMIMRNPDIQPLAENDPHAWRHDEAGPRIADA